MSLRAIRDAVDDWSDRDESVAVATLLRVRRSAPLPPGARFAVSESGELAGSISSGCVESDLHERLGGLLRDEPPEIVTYGITDEMAAEVGLACGGEIDVLLARHDPDDPAWPRLRDAVEGSEPALLLTGVAPELMSRRLLLDTRGRAGTLGDPELDDIAAERSPELMGRSEARVIELVEGDASTVVLAESFVPPPRLAIVGATPIAEALSAMAARVGFEIVLIDPREALARPERFPDATIVHAWPDEALAGLGPDPRTSVVVLTHDGKLDEPALAAALSGGAGYVGLLGGGRTQAARREALADRGFAEADLDRIHGPVGLDIGARSPEQIAVSILAQLIERGRAP